jgi:hypothetical protein
VPRRGTIFGEQKYGSVRPAGHTDGCAAAKSMAAVRKVRTPQGAVPRKSRATKVDGKCNRKQTVCRFIPADKGETVV